MHVRNAARLLLCLVASACLNTPTTEDLERSADQILSSVAGPWSGASSGSGLLVLSFQLQPGTGSAVTGSGTMRESAAPSSVPITVTGSYVRPRLSLTFSGMVIEGNAVQGTFEGDYTSIGGVVGTLRLTGTGYSRDVPVLLQEGG